MIETGTMIEPTIIRIATAKLLKACGKVDWKALECADCKGSGNCPRRCTRCPRAGDDCAVCENTGYYACHRCGRSGMKDPWPCRPGDLFDLPIRFDLNLIAKICKRDFAKIKKVKLRFDGSRLVLFGDNKIIHVTGVV